MTTITDLFTRADNAASLGNADTGETWDPKTGTWGILSNQAYVPGASALAVAGFAYGTADIDMSVVLASTPGGNNTGLTFRWSNSSNYWRLVWDSVNTNNLFLEKRVAGTFSDPAGPWNVSKTAGKTMRVTTIGSVIAVYFDGASIGGLTDSFNSTATVHGLHSNSTTAKLDSFSLAAVITASQSLDRNLPRGQLRGVTRGVA